MDSAAHSVADAMNVKKNVSKNPLKRTIAKMRHPMRAQIADVTAGKTLSNASNPNEEVHITTGEYATSAGHAVVKECATYLVGPEGEAALKKIFECQAHVVYDLALQLLVSDEIKAASHMAGREIVSGSSEGLETRLSSQWEKLPKFVTVSILPLIAVFGGLFMLGLLLALWRFALFGLHR